MREDILYYNVDDEVLLKTDCGSGSLNSNALIQHGWWYNQTVKIKSWKMGTYGWFRYSIILPDGYEQGIYNSDIIEKVNGD